MPNDFHVASDMNDILREFCPLVSLHYESAVPRASPSVNDNNKTSPAPASAVNREDDVGNLSEIALNVQPTTQNDLNWNSDNLNLGLDTSSNNDNQHSDDDNVESEVRERSHGAANLADTGLSIWQTPTPSAPPTFPPISDRHSLIAFGPDVNLTNFAVSGIRNPAVLPNSVVNSVNVRDPTIVKPLIRVVLPDNHVNSRNFLVPSGVKPVVLPHSDVNSRNAPIPSDVKPTVTPDSAVNARNIPVTVGVKPLVLRESVVNSRNVPVPVDVKPIATSQPVVSARNVPSLVNIGTSGNAPISADKKSVALPDSMVNTRNMPLPVDVKPIATSHPVVSARYVPTLVNIGTSGNAPILVDRKSMALPDSVVNSRNIPILVDVGNSKNVSVSANVKPNVSSNTVVNSRNVPILVDIGNSGNVPILVDIGNSGNVPIPVDRKSVALPDSVVNSRNIPVLVDVGNLKNVSVLANEKPNVSSNPVVNARNIPILVDIGNSGNVPILVDVGNSKNVPVLANEKPNVSSNPVVNARNIPILVDIGNSGNVPALVEIGNSQNILIPVDKKPSVLPDPVVNSRNSPSSADGFLDLDYGAVGGAPVNKVDSVRDDLAGCCYIDTHCHIDLMYNKINYNGDFASYKSRYASTWSPYYSGCITNFVYPNNYINDASLFNKLLLDDDVRFTFGCHPKNCDQYTPQVEDFLFERLSHPKVVAVGEVGLDQSQHNSINLETQSTYLIRLLKLAVRMFDLPLVIHCRDAEKECFEIMKQYVPHNHPIHLHCYMGSLANSFEWSDYFTKMYFGVTTSVCSPREQQVDFVSNVALDRLLIETDSPYFLPPPQVLDIASNLSYNHPGLGALVGFKLAELRRIKASEVFEQIFENTLKLYKFF